MSWAGPVNQHFRSHCHRRPAFRAICHKGLIAVCRAWVEHHISTTMECPWKFSAIKSVSLDTGSPPGRLILCPAIFMDICPGGRPEPNSATFCPSRLGPPPVWSMGFVYTVQIPLRVRRGHFWEPLTMAFTFPARSPPASQSLVMLYLVDTTSR